MLKQSALSKPQVEAESHLQPEALLVEETFSIPMLERKMMFLNEPELLSTPAR